MATEGDCRRRLMKRGGPSSKDMNGRIHRKSFLVGEQERKRRTEKHRLLNLMVLLLLQAGVLSIVLLPYLPQLQWPLGIFGGVDDNKMRLHTRKVASEEGQADVAEENPVAATNGFRSLSSLDTKNSIKSGLRAAPQADQGPSSRDTVESNITEDHTSTMNYMRSIPRIVNDYPSKETIKSILVEEQRQVSYNNGKYVHPLLSFDNEEITIDDMAAIYELVYAFIAAFQREGIPIFVGFGSHLGARRHHGKYM